ncbi:MAG: SDR family NAD(P)-dependent oxidoreductase, partial [Actinomycetota bacterium]
MDLGLTGKRALITGGSSGLGLATARALAREGAIVSIAARNQNKLSSAVQSIEDGAHSGVHTIVCDVSEPDAVRALVERSRELMGGVDILIANAGGPPPGNFMTTPLDAYSEALRLNLLSTVALCQLVVPAMRDRKWGRVVAITSASVREPIDRLILSNTARAGVTGFLKTLAREVAP